jgi:DNA gyrase subunit B
MACPSPYNEADIQTIGYPGEHVRRHPGMYVGNTDAFGLHHTLFALVTSALTEIAAGVGTFVSVRLNADGSATVEDDAPSILADGEPSLEHVCTQWIGHAPNPNGRDYSAYFVANALAAQVRVVASSPGSTYSHVFRQGLTHAAVQMGGPPDARGFSVEFRPDPAIFPNPTFDADTIRTRLRQLAYLHSGIRVSFTPVGGAREDFCFADGTREHVRALVGGEKVVHAEPIALRGEADGVRYEVGLQWCVYGEGAVVSYGNERRTIHEGTHVIGLRTGVTRALLDRMRANGTAENVIGEDTRDGLRAVVAVRLADAMFSNSLGTRLGNTEVEHVIASAVRAGLSAHFDAHPADAEAITGHVAEAAEARIAALEARRNLRRRRASDPTA